MSEPKLTVVPPIGRWLIAGTPLSEPYPCRCGSRCDPAWCWCAGRIDLHAVPSTCCAHRFGPREVAKAKHGGDYRPCWCRGDIDRHNAPGVAAVLPDLPDEDEEED